MNPKKQKAKAKTQGVQKQPIQEGQKSTEVEGGVNERQGRRTMSKSTNAPEEWDWQNQFRQKWDIAPPHWQAFLQHWRSKPDGDTQNAPYPLSLKIQELRKMAREILVLESYQKLFDRAWNLYLRSPDTGIVLTGQPGTGKSTWLWYALTRLLRKKQTVLFSFDGDIRLFHIDTVYKSKTGTVTEGDYPQPPGRTFIWALIDSEDRSEAPPPMGLTTGHIFPVFATSPNEKRYKHFRKRVGAYTWGMSLWKPEELRKGLPLQSGYEVLLDAVVNALINPSPTPSSDPAVANVMKAFDDDNSRHDGFTRARANRHARTRILNALDNAIALYGYSARDVYMGIFQPNVIEPLLSQAIEDASWDELQRGIPSDKKGPGEFSHRLVAVHVKTDGNIATVDDFYLDFTSGHIRDRVRDRLGDLQVEQALSMLRSCLYIPDAASLGGVIFENLAHRYLSGSTATPLELPRLLPMRRLSTGRTFRTDDASSTPASTATPSLPIRKRTIVALEWDEFKDLELKREHFYVPKAKNNPLFDSFMIEYDGNAATLWIFQMTVGKKHGGSERGYALIARIEESVRRQLRERANAASGETNSVAGQKRKKSAPEGPQKKLKGAQGSDISVETIYVLVSPDRTSEWTMPTGWTNSKGT
ncbi:hypothetical protein WOLCODRAFT_138046 [Wolfiporia cocos MD-104 SS10]|uniref:Uncharacterized protein n=1 Tax=Wolfiporia cocos (strain MD-104) TaxID=742152 RepID=A0A2H3JS30_WOLCO|nr:hypothetical protein WOLCODRAFT_138046 [Wolfiporia cocos MD-104 SS10]